MANMNKAKMEQVTTVLSEIKKNFRYRVNLLLKLQWFHLLENT